MAQVSDLSAETILDSVLSAYRSFSVYEDSGLVIEDRLAVVAFRTRFQRNHLFEFSYADIDDKGTEHFRASLVVRDGKVNLETVLKGVPPLESLRFAVAALTGISRGAAHCAAALLLDEVGGWLATDMLRPIRLQDESRTGLLPGARCTPAHPQRVVPSGGEGHVARASTNSA